MDDLISRQAVLEGLASIAKAKAKSDAQKSLMGRTMFFVERLPSVNPQENLEDIHREREQAYMRGYEDASKRYRTEPCEDAISRSDAIRVASGYCHWTNIPDELAKLPSVSTENPNRCGDAVSRQEAIDALNDMSENYEKTGKREYHPHIDFAIETIKLLPFVSVCTDAISRQAAIDCLTATKLKKFDFILQAREEIKNLPSVSTEKTGRWEWVQYDGNPNIGNWHCSECNRIVCGAITEANHVYTYKYCPECGARMGEVGDNE